MTVVIGEVHHGAAGVFSGLCDRFANAAACCDHDVIGDFEVSNDAGLSAKDDVFAGFDGTCDTCLRDDDIIGADINIVADLNVDMFLPLFPLKWLEVQGLGESTLGDDVREAAAEAGVQVQADKEPDRNRFIRSDQYSFIRRGVPALAFKFGYVPGEVEEKIFRAWYHDRYHAPSDDAKQPVDLAAAARFNDILERLAARVADAAERPRWKSDSFFRRFAQ